MDINVLFFIILILLFQTIEHAYSFILHLVIVVTKYIIL